ncbi:MAG: hypothetical protein Hals2KO_20310 [Halioglobus sp.]
MSASILVLSILVALAVLAVVHFALSQYHKSAVVTPYKPARSPRQPAVTPAESPAAVYPFRATSIEPGSDACGPVQSLANVRYLVADDNIPQLPLDACDAANCSCRYNKYRDRRRVDGDRRALGGAQNHLLTQTEIGERRTGRERRFAPA